MSSHFLSFFVWELRTRGGVISVQPGCAVHGGGQMTAVPESLRGGRYPRQEVLEASLGRENSISRALETLMCLCCRKWHYKDAELKSTLCYKYFCRGP